MLDAYLLGTSGMQPLPGRPLSALLVRFNGSLVLIDCGEGTQVSLRRAGWGLRDIRAILLTHVHADHMLGLPGLLLTLANSGKGEDDPLTIYGPEPLVPVLQGLLVLSSRLPFPLQVAVLEGGEQFELEGVPGLDVTTASMEHEVPCMAYALSVPRAPRFLPDRAQELGVPVTLWSRLQRGETVEVEGRAVEPTEVLGPPRKGLRLVMATDTRPNKNLTALVDGADLFVCEGMYGTDEEKPKRWLPQHMTFAEAAMTARDGGARQLWLTHFSPVLTNPEEYLECATAIFPNTIVGYEGLTAHLNFEE